MSDRGKVYVVGFGPGDLTDMTVRAISAISTCDTIVGYKKYTDLLSESFKKQKIIANGMGGEMERCRIALKEAAAGHTVALVCSGDAGVYGMASPLLEAAAENCSVDIEIIPGVSAAMSGGALLGSPIAHDFAAISLSDALTPWDLIEKRLRLAAEADLCIAIYNPMSNRRPTSLKQACEVLLEVLPKDRVCGFARNVSREDEGWGICTLEELRDWKLDMFATVFVGSSATRRVSVRTGDDVREYMVTPRGYSEKYGH